jgi:Uma2 family endonuclease
MLLLELLSSVSDEDLLALSRRNPGLKLERTAEGRLRVSPTGGESGRVSAEVLGQLYRWNEEKGLGVVFDAATGFRLPDGSVFSPDAAFVKKERWLALSQEEREGFPPLAPDVVFEVRSRSDDPAELREKAGLYLKNGTALVVLVDPYGRWVEAHRLSGVERFEEPSEVPLDPELPGFLLRASRLFATP